jgi:hypothetical protein
VLFRSGDALIDSGTADALSAGDSTSISFSGTWPPYAGSFFLIVEMDAGDDLNTTNDIAATSSAIAITGPPTPPVDYVVDSVSAVNTPTGEGSAISETVVISNQGTADGSKTVYWTVFRSSDTVLDDSDAIVDSGSTSALTVGTTSGAIAVTGSWPSAGGTYYLLAEVDAADDSNAANNVTASNAFTLTMPQVDYQVDASLLIGGTGKVGDDFAFADSFAIENIGADTGIQTIYWTAYASTDTTLSPGVDLVVATGSTTNDIGGGSIESQTITDGKWPTKADTYYLIIEVMASDETGVTTNNSGVSSGTFSIGALNIDYQISAPTSTGTPAYIGSAITETFDLTNAGTDDGLKTVYWTAYRSTDATLDAGDDVVDSGSEAALPAGGSSTNIAIGGYWPQTPGTFYLIVDVWADDEDPAATPNDNSSGAFTVATYDIDYQVGSITTAGTPASAGSSISESVTIQNVGTDAGVATVYWTAYASPGNTTLEAGDMVIDSGSIAALGGGAVSGGQPITGTWPYVAGTYYIIVDLTVDDDGNGANDTTASGAVTITPPDVDYDLTSVSGSGAVLTGSPISEEFQFNNLGSQDGVATVYWTAYRSSDAALDAGDVVIDSGSVVPLTAGGSSGAVGFNGVWPSTGGTYYLIVELSADDDPVSGNDVLASAQFTVSPPAVDYLFTSVTSANSPADVGTPINETFTIRNQGAIAGSQLVSWTAYVSADTAISGDDKVVDHGVFAALGAGADTGAVSIDGNWPSTAGTYYLLVELDASDDINSGNDSGSSSAYSVTDINVDYDVLTVTRASATAIINGTISETFTFRNIGSDDGSGTVYWTAYYNTNASLDGNEVVVDSGTEGALTATTTSAAINIDGRWPGTANTYYLLVKVSSEQDVATGNDWMAGDSVSVDIPTIDYRIETVSNTTPAAAPNDLINENFTFKNYGADNGSSDVYWYAYISTKDILDGVTETLFESGTASALNSGVTSGNINITGTWPAGDTGVYYLIVKLAAADEFITGNNEGASGSFTITTPTSIDYIVQSLSNDFTVVTNGSPVSETFTIKNVGDTAGANDIAWNVYASTDSVYDGGDTLINSGTIIGGLGSGVTSSEHMIGGSWPVTGELYLVVTVSAPDETGGLTGNNERSSGTFTIYDPPEYSITNSIIPAVAYGGNLNETLLSAGGGTSSFQITENNNNEGHQVISWKVYMSDNPSLESGIDTVIGSGSIGALPALGTSTVINFNGTLRNTAGKSFVIITITCSDDSDSGNNVATSQPILVWSPNAADNVETDSNLLDSVQSAEDYFVILNPGDTIQISGTMDAYYYDDYFKIITGPSTVSLDIDCTWGTPNRDMVDLYLYDSTSTVLDSSGETDNNSEPATGTWNTPVSGSTDYYINVWIYDGGQEVYGGGDPYTLTITGN